MGRPKGYGRLVVLWRGCSLEWTHMRALSFNVCDIPQAKHSTFRPLSKCSLSPSLSLSPLLSMCRFSLQWPSLSLTQDCESLSLSRVRVHMVKRGHHYQLKLWQHIQEPSPRVVMLWALIRPEGGKHGVIDFQPQAHPLSK